MTATSNASTPSMGIKLASAVGLVAFAGFYFNSWQRSLSDHYAQQQQQETETLVAETVTPSTAEMVETVVETTPVADTRPEITDPGAIADLNAKLYEQIDQNWRQYPTFDENLVYRVTVGETGAIAEYTTVNPAAAEYLAETPIPELSDTADANDTEPKAEFLVVMAPAGTLQVSPWVAD